MTTSAKKNKGVYVAIINHGGIIQSLKVFASFFTAVTYLATNCEMSAEEIKALQSGETIYFEDGDNDASIRNCSVDKTMAEELWTT